MDATTNEKIRDLHEEAVEARYSKATWKALMTTRFSPEQLAIISGDAQAGIMYLKEKDLVSLAIREYPWMNNQIEVERKDTNGKVSMVKMSSWIDRIREVGVVRPKDLIHLSNIVSLAENREAIEDLNW